MTDNTFVAPDTDNLDDFNLLMQGKAKPSEAPVENLDDTPSHVDDVDAHEDPEVDAEDDALEPEVTEEAPKPKKKTVQDRIKEQTAEKYELLRTLEAERAEKAALAAKIADIEARLPKEEPKAPPVENTGPSSTALNEDGTMKYPLGDFDPQYIADLTKYNIDKEMSAREQRLAQEAAQREAQAKEAELVTSWQTKLAEAETTLPDIRQKGQALEATLTGLTPDYGIFLAQTIMGLDAGPEVLYHLANNPDEAQAIVNQGPLKAAIALGRLEARFAKGEQPPKPRVSAAPKPAPTTRGVAVGGSVPGDTDDLDAFSAAFYATRKRK